MKKWTTIFYDGIQVLQNGIYSDAWYFCLLLTFHVRIWFSLIHLITHLITIPT